MTVEYPDLADYLAVASAVTGTEPAVVLASMKTWRTYPGVDEAEQAFLAVSSSEWDEERTAA